FEAKGETYKLNDAIKHMVTFKPLNLVTEEYPSFENGIAHMDLIMCRNVTIYFDQETTLRVVRQFYETLSNNGWLIVGHSEPISALYTDIATPNFPNTIVYHKLQSDSIQAQSTPFSELPRPSFEFVLPKAPRPVEWELPEPPVSEPEPAAEPTWQQAKAAA